MIYTKNNICKCDCHKIDHKNLHLVACCFLCFKKYLNESGEIIPEMYNKAVDEAHNEIIKLNNDRQVKYMERNGFFKHFEEL